MIFIVEVARARPWHIDKLNDRVHHCLLCGALCLSLADFIRCGDNPVEYVGQGNRTDRSASR